MSDHSSEVLSGNRFEFGENWSRFLNRLDAGRISQAELSLQNFLDVSRLDGVSFLDLGSGSGLSSLAARRLGAEVCSIDYDPKSVECTRLLRQQFFPEDPRWRVLEGSALDASFLESLGKFDIVYSWGVLHHTGSMWEGIRNAAARVSDRGSLFLSIYNDQGAATQMWLRTKKVYNRLPPGLRFLILAPSAVRLWGPTTIRDIVRGRPFDTWRSYRLRRGMSPWEDVIDWVGGYPFEVARPEELLDFLLPLDFILARLKTCAGGHGCNEYLFKKKL